uniref:Uncharacterized protein n=1 Tax=Magallana gigas TaxID=29159 RepID=K1QVE7_MAGGI
MFGFVIGFDVSFRLRDITVTVGLTKSDVNTPCGFFAGPGTLSQLVVIDCPTSTQGRFVKISKTTEFLTLCEVDVMDHFLEETEEMAPEYMNDSFERDDEEEVDNLMREIFGDAGGHEEMEDQDRGNEEENIGDDENNLWNDTSFNPHKL